MSLPKEKPSEISESDNLLYSPREYEFFVVGLGASAGGLEALERFFHEVPTDTGMAFVVVQHLSPDFESQMDQLLARQVSLPIHRVTDGIVVEPNNIYLIPPKKEMIISGGRLLLTDKDPQRGLTLPIDHFFRSLAQDVRGHGIGIILSGTGSDGSRGIVDIHTNGGLVLCQSEETSRFNGMPLSAQQTGAVDLILPPEAMPATLVRYAKESLSRDQLMMDPSSEGGGGPRSGAQGVERLFHCLLQDYGIDFTHYRTNTVNRRIQRRILLTEAESIEDYANKACENPQEVDTLYRDLLIGVTQFFRDREPFEYLETNVIPDLIQKAGHDQIRIWCAGCATGEEPYSLAMLLHQEILRQNKEVTVKIFATDLHQNSLDFASLGIYQEAQMNSLDPQLRDRYFVKTSQGWSISQELRQMIVFARHNLIADSPFTRVDMVVCRNLLIYFQPALQKKVLSLFHFALKSSGILMLGNSETPGSLSDEFELLSDMGKIYRKVRNIRIPIDTRLLSDFSMNTSKQLRSPTGVMLPGLSKVPISDSQLLSIYDSLLGNMMPPSILVNHDFEILHTFGGAEEFLKFTGGRPSSRVLDAISPEFKSIISGALHHAQKEQKVVRYNEISLDRLGKTEHYDIQIEPLKTHLLPHPALLIKFERTSSERHLASKPKIESVDQGGAESHIASLKEQLEHSQENLQATVEELETSNEELQAANEELVASNEELQSTNEELHSVNEELYSVNVQHQKRIHDLTVMTDDLENLLRCTEFGVMFLDRQLKIRKFTRDIAQHFNLIPSDVGRRINHFTYSLKHVNLVEDLENVLETGERVEREVTNVEGKPFLLRILPYRIKSGIDGVVITLIDIALLKETEASNRLLSMIVESSRDAIFSFDIDGHIRTWNKGAEELYGYQADEILGENMRCMIPESLLAEFDDICRRVASGQSIDDYVTVRIRKDGERRQLWIRKSPIINDNGEVIGISAIDRDITEQNEAEVKLRLQERAINAATNGVVICDARLPDVPIIYVNKGFERITGYTLSMISGLNCRFLQGPNSNLEVIEKIRTAIKTQTPVEVLILNYRKNGTTFWNNLKISPVRDEEGLVTHFVGIQSDVTEQVLADEELKQAKRDADAANRAKSAFLAHMSHEIRTPITTIIGLSDVLTRQVEDPETRKILEMMRYSGNHLVNLINDILDLSRVEAGKLHLEKRPCELTRLLQDLFHLMKYRADEKKLEFEFKTNGEIPNIILTDPTRLRQILINLLGNGIKFTDRGFVRLQIEADRKEDRVDLIFSVADSGTGIEAEQIPQLFKPFSQFGSGEQRYQGTGLGLAITKRLADALDGTLEVQSRSGSGSTFTFRLPTEILDQTKFVHLITSDEEESSEETEIDNFDFSSKRVLIAEDTKSIQFLLSTFLRETRIGVETAEDGERALSLVLEAIENERPYDIILLDMQMPKLDGYQVVERLRDRKVATPVIALTANAMAGDKEICLSAGCDEYLTKPVSRTRLLEKMRLLFSQTNGKVRK